MKDMSALQIDPLCIKCRRPSSKDVVLYEMRNHLFICASCRQEAEEHGKQIAWVDATQRKAATTKILDPTKTRALTTSLPPDSLFAQLRLALDTPVEEIESVIMEKMKYWTHTPSSQERKQMLELLHEWQENIEDVESFEKYRASLKPQRKGNALSVGGRSVLTAEEFVNACEASKEGWADGERYLRKELKHWALYQLQDKALANDIGQYQAWAAASNFLALDVALYRLNANRPFRLYKDTKWQMPDTVVSASTPQELAAICDLHWQSGERHLYEGAMLFWLEYCQQIEGIRQYYTETIQVYQPRGQMRGVGLELLLERVVPTLPKPNLRVTFDGTENAYTLDKWDRELAHLPVKVTITNTTRGFTCFRLQKTQEATRLAPYWLILGPSDPFWVAGRPGYRIPATAQLTLHKLTNLERGKRYQQTLTMEVLGEKGVVADQRTFPITIRTMSFYQGLRGKLWLWGLRGGLPGFFWNALVAALISFILLTLLPGLVPANWDGHVSLSGNVIPLLQGTVLVGKSLLVFLQNTFVYLNILIMGIAGFMAGKGKGHMDHDVRMGAHQFRKWAGWLSLISLVPLFMWKGDSSYIGPWMNSSLGWIILIQYIGGYFLMWLLLFIIAQIIINLRNRLENFLRSHFAGLLNLPGRA